MISTQMMKLAEANQWKVNAKEDMIFGEYNGYLFTVLEGKRFKALITPIAGISPSALEQIMQHLDHQRKALRLRNYELSDNFLCVRMEEGLFPMSSEKMEQMLGHLSGLLDLYEVPDRSCVVCGEPAQRRGLYLGLFCHLHKDCEQKDMIDFTAAVRHEEETDGDEMDQVTKPDESPEPDVAAAADMNPDAAKPETAAQPAEKQPGGPV